MSIDSFSREYLRLQGVIIMPAPRAISRPVTERREEETVPMVPMYERGDLP
jgi:hypothetical protein